MTMAVAPLFQAASDLVTGTTPDQIVSGDFNADGKLDMAVANQGSCPSNLGSVTILLGKGNGTFQPAINLTNGITNPDSLAAGDFNGDGKLDLAVVNIGVSSQQISIFLGNGDGTFQNPSTLSAGGATAFLTVADLNQDGHLDLLATIFGTKTDGLSVIFGNGNGTFQAPVLYLFHFTKSDTATKGDIISTGDGASFIAVADFKHDGKPDVAETNLSGHVAVFINSGSGTLSAPIDYNTGNNPQAVVTVDFNGDGNPDLAASCYGQSGGAGGQISILLNNSDGTFTAAKSIASTQNPAGLWAADFTGDGKQDIAFSGNNADTLTVVTGQGNGTFRAAATYAVGLNPQYVAGGDFNGDGKVDLVAANLLTGNVSLILAKGAAFAGARDYNVGSKAFGLAVADFDGDQKLDVAVSTNSNAGVSVLFGNGNGTLKAPVNYSTVPFSMSIAAADLNNDGSLDLISAEEGGATVTVQLNNGTGSFLTPVTYNVGFTLVYLALGDFNGDGKIDVVVTDNLSNAVYVLLGKGDGTLSPAVKYATTGFPYSVTVGDYNGDGKLDIAAYSDQNPTASLLLGNGDGTFQKASNVNVLSPGVAIVTGDFNLDGKADLALLYSPAGDAEIQVLLGNGDGTFTSKGVFSAGFGDVSMSVADLNGDGNPDLAVTGTVVQVRAGKGDGTFGTASAFDAGMTPETLGFGDFNGDGKLDAAVANAASKSVTLLLHR